MIEKFLENTLPRSQACLGPYKDDRFGDAAAERADEQQECGQKDQYFVVGGKEQ
jgi:hypothetical protein